MSPAVETWIVVADGAGVRIFEERERLGPLHERPELSSATPGALHAASQSRAARAGGYAGDAEGVDAGTRNEAGFLAALAKRLDAAALQGAFEHLVIMAPPGALGVLRGRLSPATLRRLEVCDPHERHTEDGAALRRRLRDLRQKA